MKFYSTNNRHHEVNFHQAVIKGLAPDGGLYMPGVIPSFQSSFFSSLHERSFAEIALEVAQSFVTDEIPQEELKRIVEQTVAFDAPLVKLEDHIFSLELFHGPTLAFKDFGARFMSQVLGYFAKQQTREVVILVATSGDTGSAVANGFLGVAGTRVVVLYPSGKVSDIQEKQFTTLGNNITAVEVNGTFDDCQRMVKEAFADRELSDQFFLTSANSINISRLIPQSFYYFYAWSRLPAHSDVVFAVPSGNFGNLTAGLIAKKMGLPVRRFVAATNANDSVPRYLASNQFVPQPSVATMSNAMDVGNPSNFARMVDLYHHDRNLLMDDVAAFSFSDSDTAATMRDVRKRLGYTLDPHGAVAYLGLKNYAANHPGITGVFLETAHPAKFKGTIDEVLGGTLPIPEALQFFLTREKKAITCEPLYPALRDIVRRTAP